MSMSGHANGDDVLEEMTKDDESLTGLPSAPGSIKEDQEFELQREDSKDDSRDADKRRNSNLNSEEIINHVQPDLEAIKLGLPEGIATPLPEVDGSSLAAPATDTQWPSRCSSTYCEADDDQSTDENASAKQQTARKPSVAHSAMLNSSMTTADIIRRLSQPTLVPIITSAVGQMFSPPPNQSNMPPSPDRLEMKESNFNYTLEPPSPGRLALKGIETDEDTKNSNEDITDQSYQLTPNTPPAEIEDNEERIQTNQKEQKAVKIPKREHKNKRSNPESLSLRQEIANRNLKRQRTEGSSQDGFLETPRLKSPMPSSQRATPSPQVPSLPENDGMSEVATVGDVDDLGSVASIASFVDGQKESKDDLDRPYRVNRPSMSVEVPEVDCQPWIIKMKGVDYDFQNFSQIVTSRREYATRLDNYLRGCCFAPDGLCILSNSNDNTLRLFNLPPALLSGQLENAEPEMESVLRIPEGEAVYDFCWWPRMNSMDPASCCFVSSAKHQPIHLFDAFNGKLRASYRIIDSVDEVASAHSLAFSTDGMQLYAGLTNEIRIFETMIPGNESSTIKLGKGYHSGIISTLAVNDDVIVAGSFSKEIGVYDSRSHNQISFIEKAHSGGVTGVSFVDDQNLISAGRKCSEIKCWDMRNFTKPIWSVERKSETNQKIQFDVCPIRRELFSGSTDGKLHYWKIRNNTPEKLFERAVHRSAANAANIHPFAPVLASGSGQRVFPNVADSDSEDNLTATPVSDNSLTIWTAFKSSSSE
ncbi:unnamed protein product [Oikopleura dioica]|uniref:Telomerase Cajal body protein 1 n=1 Tax=Oikopleura dioica TaxID=34765 RepID=E4WZU7_OIKDI|nr:unnamed protein product [Oikopleura dioica]